MTEVWWGYFAGLTDGEGTLTISKHKENIPRGFYFDPKLSVSNTNFQALSFLKEKFGNIGNIHKTSTRKNDEKGIWKPAYQFAIGKREDLLIILPKIMPMLIIKKSQAELVLEFCQRREGKRRFFRHKNGRFSKGNQIEYDSHDFEIFNKIKELNKRGKRYDD